MSEREMKQLTSDVHLIATPFRWVADLIKIVVFFAILPLVLIGSVVYHAIYGGPLLDADTWLFVKILFCVLSPFAAALAYGILVAKGNLFSVWVKEFAVLIVGFVLIGFAIRNDVITFDLSGQDSTRYTYVVQNGEATMTCQGLQDLREDAVRDGRNRSIKLLDQKLVERNCR